MKEGERLGSWEGEIIPEQILEGGSVNAEGGISSRKWECGLRRAQPSRRGEKEVGRLGR